ncbi:MAG: tetratricopeptide repeat protein [Hyphomonadaceae bacterium]
MMRIAVAAFTACLIGSGPALAAGGGMESGPIQGGMETGPSPEQLQAAYNDGVRAVEAQNWKQAVSKFKFVTRSARDNADAWNYLGYSSRKGGDLKAGEKAYQRALKINPNHPRANEYYGELLLEQNRIAEAEQRLAVLQACCAANPVTAELAGLIADAKAGKPTVRFKPSMGY